MPLIRADRVKETTTTTGTGSLTLAGAVTGFRTFDSVCDTNDTVNYVIDNGAGEWEVGVGTFTSPSTLARTTVVSSSNSNSAVNFSAGTKQVALTIVASDIGSGGGSVYYKDPVRVATTANITLSGTLTIDGVALSVDDRVLVKNQTTSSQNGIYLVKSGAWERATDANENSELQHGVQVYVTAGTVNGGNSFQLISSNATPIVVGTSTQVWSAIQTVAVNNISGGNPPVASGAGSIAIGRSKTASGVNAIVISNSTSNTGAYGDGAIKIGGASGSAGGNNSILISGGSGNIDSGGNNSIVIGSIAVGSSSNVFTLGSVVSSGGGSAGLVRNGIALGYGAYRSMPGEFAVALGSFSSTVQHTPKKSTCFGWLQTSNSTTTRLGSSNANNTSSTAPDGRFFIENNSIAAFNYRLVAFRSGPINSTVFTGAGVISRGANAAATTLVGTPSKNQDFDDSSGLTTTSFTISADTTNGALQFDVTGIASTNIRWFLIVEMQHVGGTF